MAMRTYGVETKGVAITFSELEKLILANIDNIRKVVGDTYFEDTDDIDFSKIADYVSTIDYAFWVSEFEGDLMNEDRTKELCYFDGDDVAIIELHKDTLYDKYNNRDEIILELKNALKEVGIIVDDEFIEEHFGTINGTYCG